MPTQTKSLALTTLALGLATIAGAAPTTKAVSAGDVTRARLWSILPDPSIADRGFIGGLVEIDAVKKTVRMRLYPGSPCGLDFPTRCGRPQAGPVDVELAIATTETVACGTVEIVARRDDRPSDGALHEITIRDNRRFGCVTNSPLPATVGIYVTKHYDRLKRGEVAGTTVVSGDALVASP